MKLFNLALGFGSTAILVIFLSGILIGAFCWPYSINTWLLYVHKTPSVVWWQGALIGLVPGIGHLGLPIAVITWVAMLFLN